MQLVQPLLYSHSLPLDCILIQMNPLHITPVAYPGIFFGGVQQIQLRTEDREDGDLGVVAP